MQRLTVFVLGVLVLTAACGGGSDGPEPTESPSTPDQNGSATATATASSRAGGQEIGRVEDADGNAFVNETRASQELKLHAGDGIVTRSGSSIDFTLDNPRVECKTLSNSDLRLRPDDQTQIFWNSRTGVSYCNVERGQPPVAATFGVEPNIEIAVEGTLFGVVEDGTLRVVEGFVTLKTGSTTQRVGPNEQVVLAQADQPGARDTWQGLPDDEQPLVSDLQSRRSLPSLVPTDQEFRQSKLLNAMRGQGAVLVLLDDSASAEDQDFVWSYFGRLGEAWLQTENVDVQPVSRQEAEALLRQYPNAVYVAPESSAAPPSVRPTGTATGTPTPTAQPLNLGSSPFYIDGDGGVWDIKFPAEPATASAFARFTKAILTTGEYFDMYSSLFGGAPPYDRLLQLLS